MARMNMESISKFFELNGQALINSILLSEDSSGSGFTDDLVDPLYVQMFFAILVPRYDQVLVRGSLLQTESFTNYYFSLTGKHDKIVQVGNIALFPTNENSDGNLITIFRRVNF